ncbi:tetratricopeptide repeat protein [Crenalkalicoccus roseus]|uniref:tetratricopeptide repeat protein n=1 Tax=Crenalkalicoccus roseus TaxID=1485588 RepID=UPI0010807110|nr:tetratricopeptide repeat protein [Crenalkalicoccus roseus]
MRLLPPLPAGALAGLLLAAAGAAAETALPLPPRLPEPPQAAPDRGRCAALLRQGPEAAFPAAEAWRQAGGGEEAERCAALALLGLGESARAAERLEALALRSGADRAARAALFAQAGQAWMLAGEADRAFAAATLGLTLAPEDAELLLDRAVALGTARRFAEAREDLDRLLALDPGRAEGWVLRAAALRNLGRLAEAEADIARALSLAPDHAEALLERGLLRRHRGDLAGARGDWGRVIALAPGSATAELAAENLATLGGAASPRRR